MRHKRRNRLQHPETDLTEMNRRAEIRATRDAFYAKRRGDRREEPDAIVEEAAAEPELAPVVPPGDVEVPADWQSLHWKKRVALAKACYPGFKFVNGDDADGAIRRYLGGE